MGRSAGPFESAVSDFVVALAPGAETDIGNAVLWYRERNALTADAFRTEVFHVIDRIGQMPLGRPADEEGMRHRVLRRFPYSVIYEVLGSTITVLAVAHHRRKPNYWRPSGG